MNKTLFSLGILVSAVGIVWWFAGGAHTGWSKTKVMRTEPDPITGIDQPIWDDRFVPGIDFLVAAEVLSTGFITAAFLLRRKPTPTN